MKLSLLTFNSLPFTYEVNVPGEVFEFFFFYFRSQGLEGWDGNGEWNKAVEMVKS